MSEKEIRQIVLRMQASDLRRRLRAINDEISESSATFEKKKNLPSDILYGYKWVHDECLDVYIVKLQIIGWYWIDHSVCNSLDYVSDKVKIIDILRIRDECNLKKIDTYVSAYVDDKMKYAVGKTINKKTWFCLSPDNLLRSQGQFIKQITGNGDAVDVYADPPIIYNCEGSAVDLASF